MSAPDQPISDDIRRFLLHCIPSVPHLEALLLLCANFPPAVAWNCSAVAARLYLQDRSTASLLSDLAESGLLACVDEEERIYSFAPRSEELAAVVRELEQVYARQLIEVTQLIHSTTGRKAQQFAEAFRWRKK